MTAVGLDFYGGEPIAMQCLCFALFFCLRRVARYNICSIAKPANLAVGRARPYTTLDFKGSSQTRLSRWASMESEVSAPALTRTELLMPRWHRRFHTNLCVKYWRFDFKGFSKVSRLSGALKRDYPVGLSPIALLHYPGSLSILVPEF